jgi:hypothetical protein
VIQIFPFWGEEGRTSLVGSCTLEKTGLDGSFPLEGKQASGTALQYRGKRLIRTVYLGKTGSEIRKKPWLLFFVH